MDTTDRISAHLTVGVLVLREKDGTVDAPAFR